VQARARAIRDAQEKAAREPIVAPVDPDPPDGGAP
jgi:hypothetical protein